MPILQVRDIPEDLYQELTRVARLDNRSIAQQTIVLLRRALGMETGRIARRKALLDLARDLGIDSEGQLPDPVDLIREDRKR